MGIYPGGFLCYGADLGCEYPKNVFEDTEVKRIWGAEGPGDALLYLFGVYEHSEEEIENFLKHLRVGIDFYGHHDSPCTVAYIMESYVCADWIGPIKHNPFEKYDKWWDVEMSALLHLLGEDKRSVGWLIGGTFR